VHNTSAYAALIIRVAYTRHTGNISAKIGLILSFPWFSSGEPVFRWYVLDEDGQYEPSVFPLGIAAHLRLKVRIGRIAGHMPNREAVA